MDQMNATETIEKGAKTPQFEKVVMWTAPIAMAGPWWFVSQIERVSGLSHFTTACILIVSSVWFCAEQLGSKRVVGIAIVLVNGVVLAAAFPPLAWVFLCVNCLALGVVKGLSLHYRCTLIAWHLACLIGYAFPMF